MEPLHKWQRSTVSIACEEKRIDMIIRVGRDPAPAAV
jgi:hypothetical protein